MQKFVRPSAARLDFRPHSNSFQTARFDHLDTHHAGQARDLHCTSGFVMTLDFVRFLFTVRPQVKAEPQGKGRMQELCPP